MSYPSASYTRTPEPDCAVKEALTLEDNILSIPPDTSNSITPVAAQGMSTPATTAADAATHQATLLRIEEEKCEAERILEFEEIRSRIKDLEDQPKCEELDELKEKKQLENYIQEFENQGSSEQQRESLITHSIGVGSENARQCGLGAGEQGEDSAFAMSDARDESADSSSGSPVVIEPVTEITREGNEVVGIERVVADTLCSELFEDDGQLRGLCVACGKPVTDKMPRCADGCSYYHQECYNTTSEAKEDDFKSAALAAAFVAGASYFSFKSIFSYIFFQLTLLLSRCLRRRRNCHSSRCRCTSSEAFTKAKIHSERSRISRARWTC
jgi:hypothetical protein